MPLESIRQVQIFLDPDQYHLNFLRPLCQLRDLGAETSNLVPAGLGAEAKAERVRLGPRQKPGPLSAANLNVMQPRIVGGTLPTFTVAASGPRLEAGARDQVVLRGASATPSSSLPASPAV